THNGKNCRFYKFIEEIKRTKDTYGAKVIFFSDDTFSINREWLITFLKRYRKEINKPFMCVVRADHINENIIREMSLAGCHTISMGVETGNETIRNITLNKGISDESLKRTAGYMSKHKIRLQTSNMFGIPGETEADALRTIRFNIELRTSFAFAAMLLPLPGTGIEKIALDLGWLDKPLNFDMLPQSFFSRSVFEVPEIEVLENVKDVAYWCVAYPKLYKTFEKLIRIRCRPLFQLLDRMGIFFRYKRERRLSLIEAIRMFWRYRRSQ
ncbi:MAG: radical SAM protein, partial [Candidatus Auribacterota bacterium]|nr:radical SAM protein [Candidatus Auribacterota bacterium]